MSGTSIPCSVQVLTRNSGENLRACLESLMQFAEVVVLDGYSTDDTREIAAQFSNVRLMDQNKDYLDADGRITDFAAVRNEGLKAAAYDWILMIDSDEIVQPVFVEEVAQVVRLQPPGAYRVFRRFVAGGVPVEFCAGYPAYHIRLFHRSVADGYGKSVHEKVLLHPGQIVRTLQSELLVPLPPACELNPKYHRYLQMEVRRLGTVPWGRWFRWILYRNMRSVAALCVRVVVLRILPRKGKRMPFAYEWQAIRHLLQTTWYTFPLFSRRVLP
ncbi:MAG: glycosyl transferase [Candidatus Peribacteria bacterium]|nr:glycosyl transferase [Candidatus Peribacteria bacterium]